MTTALGPQSPNYTTARPANDAAVSLVDTWFKDCSAPGVADGTVPTASWFNVITAQLRTAIKSAEVELDDADDGMLYKAMIAVAKANAASLTASHGIERDGDSFQLTVGQGKNPVLTSGAVALGDDLLPIYDASGELVSEISVYEVMKAAMSGFRGAVFDDADKTISMGASKFTASEAAPLSPQVSDWWYKTDISLLFARINDGNKDIWIQV